MHVRRTILALTLALAPFAVVAQDPGEGPPLLPRAAADQDPQDPPAGAGRGGQQGREPVIRPYDRVITKEAKSDEGIFTVHRIGDRLYYEIPKDTLGREFLWVSQIAKTTLGAGYGGQAAGNRVVRWERRGDRILLRAVSYEVVADPATPIARAVAAANHDPIVMAFNVEAEKDGNPVIEVTRLFTTDVPEFSGRTRVGARTFDASRSFVDRAVSFPENIEVEATHTYNNPPAETPAAGRGTPAPAGRGRGQALRPGSHSVVMHYSMVLLPEKPMQPRLFDERVGYFSTAKVDYGLDEHRAPQRRYITRWRLEKKDPNAALSEPVKPIVYYIDPATPKKWVPYLKAGVESWQVAFEAAGFKNAVIAKDAPTPEEDPDWSPEDARYSVIRWLPSTIENASGPHIHDPRSGEILETDIQFYHNVMNLSRNWYFVQVGHLDPRAKTLPLPDDLMGKLIQYVAAHEVGHTLGFQHNMKASSMYTLAQVRDPKWVKENGHTPTLMDYSRFNYVAQPEDGIALDDLIPKIGPYDKWATMWGYKPIAGAKSPDDEKKTLDQWARQQDTTPWYRFSTAGSAGSDPGELTEAVGDADAVAATTLGMKNLERIAGMLLTATTTRTGDPYTDLAEVYGRVLGQWALEMNHVAAIVGGYNSQQKHIGQNGVRFQLLPREKQQAAVKFLVDHAFHAPKWALNPEILRRIEPVGVLGRIEASQTRVLNSLLSSARVNRLVEQEALDGSAAYAPLDFLGDVRKGVFSELYARTAVDAYRRNLQRAYVETLSNRANGPQAQSDDVRAFFRGELKTLEGELDAAARSASVDRATQLHYQDLKIEIAKALDAAAQAPANRSTTDLDDEFDVTSDRDACWIDYVVRPRGAGQR
ncbi:MAG TPA: zinc-dependent metalloprotease [Vicinamibacterales bacterium]|nr:zinc-dependent metalloprotease [Vicinamibacterales bacterium]